MSLSGKILVILAAVVALYSGVDYLLQRATIARSIHQLERHAAARDVERVVEAIREEEKQLDQLCLSRASSDESTGFVQAELARRADPGGDPRHSQEVERYLRSSLEPARLERERLDLLYLCGEDGAVLWGRILDPSTRRGIALRDFPADRLDPRNPLVARGVIERLQGTQTSRRGVESRSGVLLTERGAMLVSSRPILSSKGEGPPHGMLIVGRFLGTELVDVLSQRTRVPFDLWPLDGSELPAAEREALAEVTSSPRPVLAERDADVLYGYTTVQDLMRSPGLLVRARVDRDISRMGAASLGYAWISTLTAGLMLMLVLLVLLKRTVLTPITVLSRNAVAIGRDERCGVKFDTHRNDEIGILSREFDDMIEKLARSREALVSTARTAGMSEIATGILHNVGNVLNSVNVSATLLARRVETLGVDDLEQLNSVLLEHADDLSRFVGEDPRGQVLQPFIGAIAENLREIQAEIGTEVVSLTKGIAHIRDLVSAQQRYAVRGGLVETVDLASQIEEALALADKALARDPGLSVEREFAALPPVPIDRHKLIEILVNLIQNARQAMAEGGAGDHRLVLRALPRGDWLRIEVQDNGPGIAREHLVQVFHLGFTTKKSGHGVGLHASANAAREMGGRLFAESAGRGHGATFVLELPLTRQPQADATT
jgi:signal transduction histidine kinase